MPEKKRDRRLNKTDKAIQEALLDLLTGRPLAKISVSDVARQADIDRKTFYLHYATVEDAYQAIADNIIGESMARIEEHLQITETMTPLSIFEAYFSSIGEIFLDERFIAIWTARTTPLELVFRYYGDSLRRLMLKSEIFTVYNDKHREYVVSFLLYLTVGTYYTWLDNGRKESLDELTVLASRLAAQGLQGMAQ